MAKRKELMKTVSSKEITENSRILFQDSGQYVIVNGREYEVNRIFFFDKTGVKYELKGSLTKKGKDHEDVNYVQFDKEIKWKRAVNFNMDQPFIKSIGKAWNGNKLRCELYIPMSYLKSVGSSVTKREESYGDYITYKKEFLETKYFEFLLSMERVEHFDKRLSDLMKQTKKAKGPDELKKILKDTMSLYYQ